MCINMFIILLTLSVILNIGLVAYYLRSQHVEDDAVELQAAALNAAANAIAITDRNGIIQWVNPAFTRLTGYTFAEAQGQHMRLLRSDKHSNAFYKNLQETIESGLIWEDEIINVRKDGREYVEQQTITPIKNENDEINHYVAIKQDYTAHRRKEEKLLRQKNYLAVLHQITLNLLNQRNLDDLLQDIVDWAVEFMDAHFCEIMFLDGDELVVRAFTPNRFLAVGDRIKRGEVSLSWQAFDTHRAIIIDDYSQWPLRHGVYDELNLGAVIALPILIGDTCIGVLDISRSRPGHTYDDAEIQAATLFAQLAALAFTNAQLHERLHQESIRDPLTGLFNRRFMEETLVKEISKAKRKSSHLSVAMLDLDYLKELNDTFGHQIGDDALLKVSSLIKGFIRFGDTASRYGGDEFVLILSDTTLENAKQRMEQLLTNIERIDVLHEGKTIRPLSLSIGVAGYPSHAASAREILNAADKALYQAKQAGRNCVMSA